MLINNKRASYQYLLFDKYECGISLYGNEVKSLASGNASIDEAFIFISANNEAYIINMYIAPYALASTVVTINGHRKRKLLLHKKEIEQMAYQVKKNRYTIIPLKIYYKNDKIKMEIALAKKKNAHDKRESIKLKDSFRDKEKYI